MIILQTTAQTLRIATPIIATGTHEYLTAKAEFKGPQWNGAIKYVNFEMGPFHYRILLHEDMIEESQRLDLTAGTWTVWIEGYHYDEENDVISQKITTKTALLEVVDIYGEQTWPEFTPEVSEELAVEIGDVRGRMGEIERKANEGEFDGATFTPDVDDEGNISWTNDRGKENPETKNIRGPVGDSGVWIGEEEPPDDTYKVWIQPAGTGAFAMTSFELISGTHAPGTYDTYRATLTDGSYVDIPVYNGADGSGQGDMVASLYDTHSKREDIFDYADAAAEAAQEAAEEALGEAVETLEGAIEDLDNFFIARQYYTRFADIWAAYNEGKTIIMCGTAVRTYTFARVYSTQEARYFEGISVAAPGLTNYRLECRYVEGGDVFQEWAGTGYITAKELYRLADVAISGAYADLSGKPTLDSAVTQSSANAVTSAGIYQAIQNARTTVDSALSSTSENPVQNKVVKAAIDGINLTADADLNFLSTNPIQNKAVANKFSSLQSAITGNLLMVRELNKSVTLEPRAAGYNAFTVTVDPTYSGYSPIAIAACEVWASSGTTEFYGEGAVMFLGTEIGSSRQYGAYVCERPHDDSITLNLKIKVLYVKSSLS